ncbi:uncharacterized protein [Panulirus ornatus]|uniref:uncharacterized protein n=1 Tax=Panulirus ornatus TaxID=150431 RepID=UPI003A86051D
MYDWRRDVGEMSDSQEGLKGPSSTITIVWHVIRMQLESSQAGDDGLGMSTMGGGGGGRANKGTQKIWLFQFRQYKTLPQFISNASSIEMNTVFTANSQRQNHSIDSITRNSLLVTHSTHHKNSIHQLAALSAGTDGSSNVSPPTPQLALPNYVSHQTTHTIVTHSSSTTTLFPSASNPPESVHLALPPALRVTTPSAGDAESPGLVTAREDSEETSMMDASREDPGAPRTKVNQGASGDKVKHNAKSEGQIRNNRVVNTAGGRVAREIGVISKMTEKTDNLIRRIIKKKRCNSGDSDCDDRIHVPQKNLLEAKQLNTAAHVSTDSPSNSREMTNSYFKEKTSGMSINYKRSNTNQITSEKNTLRTNKQSSDPLREKLSETEKEFERLHLREHNDLTTFAPPLTEKVSLTSKTRNDMVSPIEKQIRKLPVCPEIPPHLLGRLDINLERLENLQLKDVLRDLEWVAPGGRWSPVQDPDAPCLPRHKVAVILPYRDRFQHLIIILSWLHPILRRQRLEYTIYVAEQGWNSTFNKGAVMNAGFMEVWQRSDANCLFFHDVDLLPEDDRNIYSCSSQPRHLSACVDTLKYKLPYFVLVGGVLGMRTDHFLLVNGYSNKYWGWGGEDDDMGFRILQSGLTITRPPSTLARYTMIRHPKRRPLTWKIRGQLLKTSWQRYRQDGLNTLKYSLLSIYQHPLFTHLLLDVGTPPEEVVRLDATEAESSSA